MSTTTRTALDERIDEITDITREYWPCQDVTRVVVALMAGQAAFGVEVYGRTPELRAAAADTGSGPEDALIHLGRPGALDRGSRELLAAVLDHVAHGLHPEYDEVEHRRSAILQQVVETRWTIRIP